MEHLKKFYPKEKPSADPVESTSLEVGLCCPPSFCALIERVSEEYRVALIRSVLVWIVGVTAWAASPLLEALQTSFSVNALFALFVTLTIALIIGVVAYGVLSIPVEHQRSPNQGSYPIIQLGLIVGASFGLPKIASYVLILLDGTSFDVTESAIDLGFVVAVMGLMLATAYKLGCSRCLCPIQCLAALAYASAAVTVGYSLNIGFDSAQFLFFTPQLLVLRGLFLILTVVTLAQMIFCCAEQVCVPLSVAFIASSVARAISAISKSSAIDPRENLVNPLFPILVPLVLLCGFYALWSLLKCGCGIVTERGIVAALSSSAIPAVLVFALPLVREAGGIVAYTVVPVLVATAVVILLSHCIYSAEDCIALILMVASIGAYAYGIVATSTTFYEVFLVLSGPLGFNNDYTISRNAAQYLGFGILLLTVFTGIGWPTFCPVTRISAARSLAFSAVGAGPAVLFASFAAYLNAAQSSGNFQASLVQALLAWLPIAGSAIALASSCCAAETFGGIGVAFGSVAFAKGFGLYSVYGLAVPSVAKAIPVWMALLPILVAVGVAVISGFLAKTRCGLCPRDSLAAFATALSIIPLSNVFAAISLGIYKNSALPTVINALASVLPVYEAVAYIAAFAGLYFFAVPLIACKKSPVECCNVLAASPAFLAPAYLGGVLVLVILAAFEDGAQTLLFNQWPSLAGAILFSSLIFAVVVPLTIRIFGGRTLSCRPPAFKCTWPTDIIVLAIAAIFAGPLAFEEIVRLGSLSSGLLWNLVRRLQDLLTSVIQLNSSGDSIAVFFTALFGWLLAPLVLNAFLVFIDDSDQLAAMFLAPLGAIAKCIGIGSTEQLALAAASALSLYALVFWQIGTEWFFGQLLKSRNYDGVTVFGWYLVLLAFFVLIVTSAILLRFDASSPFNQKLLEKVKQWII